MLTKTKTVRSLVAAFILVLLTGIQLIDYCRSGMDHQNRSFLLHLPINYEVGTALAVCYMMSQLWFLRMMVRHFKEGTACEIKEERWTERLTFLDEDMRAFVHRS